MTKPALLTVREVAEKLGITRFRVYRCIQRGDLPSVPARTGNTLFLVDEDDLQAYIDAGGPDNYDPQAAVLNGKWITTGEAARRTGLTMTVIRGMCHSGQLKFIQGGGPNGRLHVRASSIEKLIGN